VELPVAELPVAELVAAAVGGRLADEEVIPCYSEKQLA
jgi:hypothetical protein